MYSDEVDSVARSVTDHPYRRILFFVLDSCTAPVSIRELSRAILAYDRSAVTTAPTSATDYPPTLDRDASDPAAVETMAAQLHHVHLPRLASVGLIQYDADESVVTDWSHPAVGDRWLTSPPLDQLSRVIARARSASIPAN